VQGYLIRKFVGRISCIASKSVECNRNSKYAQFARIIYRKFIDALILYPKLLIAVVNGPAIGIASTMLGIFDMVYASNKVSLANDFTRGVR